jgi:hypothetical protein
MTTTDTSNKQIVELYRLVQAKKAEIVKLTSKPNWFTHCTFNYPYPSPNSSLNLRTQNKETLINITKLLLREQKEYEAALEILELPKEEFLYQGYTVEQWLIDIKTVLGKLTLESKKAELKILEDRLNPILPADFKVQLELEELTQLADKFK